MDIQRVCIGMDMVCCVYLVIQMTEREINLTISIPSEARMKARRAIERTIYPQEKYAKEMMLIAEARKEHVYFLVRS